MKAITLLFLGLVSAHKLNRFKAEVEDALLNMEDGQEDVDEQYAPSSAGLPKIRESYYLQTDSDVNNSMLIEAKQRVKNRHQFGEGCSLSEKLHTGTALDLEDDEADTLDDTAEYTDMKDAMNIQINTNNKILVEAE